ncbi:hypothetical protein HBH56_069580 [Parastagonospora nodorum]|uniref:Uncharacterized protein n=1 Tax=Phaeosphaeria nodorum (strain SN15 / ATCC MYA-4574 / FGSC 10173) TaxID=321614 RepID=A0A7U2HWV9_PHANO|nr:hypothetical protein HBH56_069580 [Parastagonospora nodorum]QRC93598.1 hypothetical protein JI435_404140 [Parastagonospora nodorum SN15]KAH3932640.1 hypothetical protein HBH54_078550 [Parastagonospora nodorum]KAH3988353.1 hypothetical protein HBH51_002110 [Parastagonospora nodorum]KAH4143932.1 hypothetical protein HBH45_033580 [Parastagonospora nodorum]
MSCRPGCTDRFLTCVTVGSLPVVSQFHFDAFVLQLAKCSPNNVDRLWHLRLRSGQLVSHGVLRSKLSEIGDRSTLTSLRHSRWAQQVNISFVQLPLTAPLCFARIGCVSPPRFCTTCISRR